MSSVSSSGKKVVNSQFDSKESSPSTGRGRNDEGDFVNVGFNTWTSLRQQWRTPTSGPPSPANRTRPIDHDEIADRIFRATGGPIHLPYPVPLLQMVEILNDAWEAEGLYD